MDGDGGLLTGFAEKPAEPVSDLVSTAGDVPAFHPGACSTTLTALPPPKDIGYDLLPSLVSRAFRGPGTGLFPATSALSTPTGKPARNGQRGPCG